MVEYKPTAAKRLLYLLYLFYVGIDAEFIAVFHFNTSHILLVLYILLDSGQRSASNSRDKVKCLFRLVLELFEQAVTVFFQ